MEIHTESQNTEKTQTNSQVLGRIIGTVNMKQSSLKKEKRECSQVITWGSSQEASQPEPHACVQVHSEISTVKCVYPAVDELLSQEAAHHIRTEVNDVLNLPESLLRCLENKHKERQTPRWTHK